MTRTSTARRRPWGRTHGTIAVAALLATALDDLLTAVIGWPPVRYVARRFARPIADAWRSAAWRSTPREPVAIITIRTPERTPSDANPTR
jgi:hypothetical protein